MMCHKLLPKPRKKLQKDLIKILRIIKEQERRISSLEDRIGLNLYRLNKHQNANTHLNDDPHNLRRRSSDT